MANVKTYNLTIWLEGRDIVFRGISRSAVERYIVFYRDESKNEEYQGSYLEERK